MKNLPKRLTSILLTLSLALGLLPNSFFAELMPIASAANEYTPVAEYSYLVPKASFSELSPVIPPVIIDDTEAVIPNLSEQKRESEYIPSVAEFKTPEVSEDDSRFIALLRNNETFSELSKYDAGFFCSYIGITTEVLSWFDAQGVSLKESVDYATIISVLDCAPTELLGLHLTASQLQTILTEASVYNVQLRDDLKETVLDEKLRFWLLQGYSCDQIFDAYALSQLFGGEINEYLDSDAALVLSSKQAEQSDNTSGLQEQFESMRSQLMTSSQPLRGSGDDIDIQTTYLGAPFVYDNGENESISLNSGALTYDTVDFVLPGINGLDLAIGRHYSSQDANIRRPDAVAHEYLYDAGYVVVYGALAYYYVPGIGTGRWSYYDEEYVEGPFTTYSQAQAFAATCPTGQTTYPDYSGGADLILEYYAEIVTIQDVAYYYTSTTATNDFLPNVYGLGHGWSFNFSSVETIGNTKYLHLADGTVYEVNLSANGSHLVDYPLTDMVFTRNRKGFSNGSVYSEYRLKYQDGKEEFFSEDGKLIGIRDRFQNTITFLHDTQNGYPHITITDTIGRVIVISGNSTSDGHVMTVQLPNSITLSYAVAHDNDARALSSYTDPVGNTTFYSYTKQTAGFDISHENTTTASVDYLNLTTITHPTLAQSVYTYEVTERNIGAGGLMQVYRITSRKDLLGSDEYNCLTYSYAQDDYTGYPHHKNKKHLPATFSYYTTVTDGNGVETKATFDRDHVLTRKDVQKNFLLISSEEYSYTNKLPTEVISYNYSPDNQLSPMVSTVCKEYDEKGRVTASWSVLAEGDLTDVEHKTTYTYNSSYGLPISTTYKTDPNTTVELRNTLDTYGKTITKAEVYVNNDLKRRTDFTYDTYGNVLSEMRYYHYTRYHHHDWQTTLFGTHDLVEYTYSNNAYLTSVVSSGIKTADGTDALASPGKTAGTIAQYYSYDTLGRMTGTTDGNGNTTAFTYDALGNVTQITNPDNTTVTYSRNYLLNTVTVTNENGAQTCYSYTPLGLESEIVDVLSNNIISHKEYDNMSRLSQISEYVYGSTTEYLYDDLGRVTCETVKQGNVILSQQTTAYDDAAENGLYHKVTQTVVGDTDAPSVVTTQYTDKAGNLVKTGKFLNNTEHLDTATYNYVGNLLTRLTAADAAKNLPFSEKYEYDENGQVTKAYNADNQYITNTYDVRGRLISSTDYAGTPTEYTYDDLDRLLTETITIETGVTATSKYDYDAAGNIICKWTPTNAVGGTETWSKCEYTYDSRKNLTSVKQYDGAVLSAQTSYTYDNVGNVLSMTAGGHTTEYTYDRYGNVLTTEDALGQTESNSYSALGKLLSKTDRNGITTSFSYDALGRILATVAGSGTNAETIQYAYTKTGQIASESNHWQQTSYTYDELGLPILVEETELDPVLQTFVVTLDADGGAVYPGSLWLNTGDTYVLPTPVKVGYTFDGWYLGSTLISTGDTVQVTEGCTLTAHWSANEYTITLNANGGQVTPDELNVTWDDVYALPTPTKTGYIFDGWYLDDTRIYNGDPVRITEDSTIVAHWTVHHYTVTLNANSGQVSPSQVVVSEYGVYDLPTPIRAGYVFDGWYLGNTQISNGDPVQITEDSTFVAHWTESAFTITLNATGGLVSPSAVEVGNDGVYTLPAPAKTGYSFIGWYLGTTRIPSDGSVPLGDDCTLTAHWQANRYTVTFHRNTSPEDTVTYFEGCRYDADLTLNSYGYWHGHVLTGWCTSPDVSEGTFYAVNTTVRNLTDVPNGTVHLYAIWEAKRGDGPEPESSDPPAPTYTKSYTYDLAGNRTGFTLTQGSETIQELAYTYDTLNRLSSVSMDNVTQASYTYDTNGNRASLTYPNGVTETYTYNLANWITGLTNSDGVDTLSSFAYTYYASGNRMSETDHSGKTISYTYDGLGRLTQESETNGKTVAYSYDAAGNRTLMTVTGTEAYTTAYTYDANNRLLSETKTQAGGNTVTSYTYDANGNTLSKTVLAGNDPAEVTAFSYDRFNQLTSVTAGGCPVYYSYNASGIRTAKLTNGIQTSFLLDGGDVVAELQNDMLYASYLRGINLICRDSGSAAEYYLFDAHSDVIALTDETGEVTKDYDYDAFGCETQPDPLDCNPFRYCGEYFDVETGSYYLRARYYVPTIGRFFAEDSSKAGSNWYAYCGNNPIAFIDPWGLEQIVVSGGRYRDGSGYQYEFIETAIKQIYEWLFSGTGESIAWIIADEGWSKSDKRMFSRISSELGINLVYITDKQELFDYINNGQNRSEDPITAFTIFSHGFADDDGIISLGFNYSSYNTSLNIYKRDIMELTASAFNNPTTKFYSCNTGTTGESSFAQKWVNRFGGETTAFVGRSDYERINIGTPLWVKVLKAADRALYGFSPTGSYNYPVAGKDAYIQMFFTN